jgi:hypothetical protein
MLSLRVNSVTTKQEDRPMARVEGSGTDSSDFIDSVGEVMIATKRRPRPMFRLADGRILSNQARAIERHLTHSTQ